MTSDTGGPLWRFRRWRRDLLTPEHVEKASRWERARRRAWLVGSTFLAVVAVTAPLVVVARTGATIEDYAFVASALYVVAATLIVDRRLFPWGVERFDLVAPWQFRDAEAAERRRDRKQQRQDELGARNLEQAREIRQTREWAGESDNATLALELEHVEDALDERGEDELRRWVASVRSRLVGRGIEEAMDDEYRERT